MKKILILIVCIGVSIVAAADQYKGLTNEIDFVGSVGYYMPGDDDTYDTGFGVELQARYWVNPMVGVALAVGGAQWGVNGGSMKESEADMTVAASLDGDITIIPIGGSVWFRPVNTRELTVSLEAGARYVMVDSQADGEVYARDSSGSEVYYKETVDVGDGFVGVIGANIEGRVSQKVSVCGGVGYQFDITKGDAEWLDEDLGDSELNAFIIKVGVVVRL